jgi:hypothetical protein
VQEAMDELKAMTNGIIPLEIPFIQSVIKNHVNTNGGKVCSLYNSYKFSKIMKNIAGAVGNLQSRGRNQNGGPVGKTKETFG